MNKNTVVYTITTRITRTYILYTRTHVNFTAIKLCILVLRALRRNCKGLGSIPARGTESQCSQLRTVGLQNCIYKYYPGFVLFLADILITKELKMRSTLPSFTGESTVGSFTFLLA